jgi:transcription elongation factor Elf1
MNLGEWNRQRAQYWADARRKVTHPDEFSNGFDCPKCGGVLYDTGQLASMHPNILVVKCKACGAKDKRYE